ncbi:MAG: UbiX family flavin prenyltransferase [Rikenellaceae bacterium]
MNITVAITGASGSIYAKGLVEMLISQDLIERVTLIYSDNGREVMDFEGVCMPLNDKIIEVKNGDFYNHTVSGSSCDDVMVVVPCSVGMMSRMACGTSDDTISRAADVMLKERKKLIVVVRETPLSLIHLRNMASLTEAGAVVMPASPSFYSKPTDIDGLCRSVTERIMSLIGFETGYKWNYKNYK